MVEEDGVVLGDRERVLQIGRALVDNALVHTPAGDGGADRRRGLGRCGSRTTGPGIPAEHREQVFARFTRLEGSRASGAVSGSRSRASWRERMGGTLELASEPGSTVFTLRLPGVEQPLRDESHEPVAR